MAQRAIEGDQEALDYLDLEESDVKWTTASTLTLCGNYNYCAHVLVVATHLKLDTMHRTSRYALQSLTWITRHHHYNKELPPIATTCRVEDLVEMMALIIDDVPPPPTSIRTRTLTRQHRSRRRRRSQPPKNEKKN